jgi:hypothetical protein
VITAGMAYPAWALMVSGTAAGAWLGQLILLAPAGLLMGGATESEVMAGPKGVSRARGARGREARDGRGGDQALLCAQAQSCTKRHTQASLQSWIPCRPRPRSPPNAPSQMRATVAGLGLALAAAAAGGGAPLAALTLARLTRDPAAPAYLLIAAACVSAPAAWLTRRKGMF